MNTKSLLRDSDWRVLEGEIFRVIEFSPLARVEDGKVIDFSKVDPYASIKIKVPKVSQPITGFITHKIDFLHLWEVFKRRGVKNNEEVIASWVSRKPKFLSFFFPKLWIMLCAKDAFNLMTDNSFKTELTGEARWYAEKPIMEWRPDQA